LHIANMEGTELGSVFLQPTCLRILWCSALRRHSELVGKRFLNGFELKDDFAWVLPNSLSWCYCDGWLPYVHRFSLCDSSPKGLPLVCVHGTLTYNYVNCCCFYYECWFHMSRPSVASSSGLSWTRLQVEEGFAHVVPSAEDWPQDRNNVVRKLPGGGEFAGRHMRC
jgi:hypothetical protein